MSTSLISFNRSIKIKEKYISRVRKSYAVGSTLEKYDPSQYPIELGLPEWLAYLENRIFEGLSKEKPNEWPLLFLESIPVGVETEIIKHQLSVRRLNKLIDVQRKNDSTEDYVKKVLDVLYFVKSCHELKINKNSDINWSMAIAEAEAATAATAAWLAAAWSANAAARSAAWSATAAESTNAVARSAAWSANAAARSAAQSAKAEAATAAAWLASESAANAAESAAWSAESAAWSAELAAGSAELAAGSAELAWLTAWQEEADFLIECLKN